MRDRLTAYLVASLGAGSPDIARALATFDDDDLKALVDDENPTLRAAVAALTATPFESAIDTLLASGFTALRFGPLPNAANLATTSGATGSRTIVFNNRHEAEDFRILIGTMAHEVLHAEIANSDAEEAINHAIGAMLTMQTLSVSPELAYANTEYARANNTEVMIFSNSREAGSPDSEIYAPTGLGIAPDSPFDVPDLWTAFGGDGSSPGSPTLRTMLQNILVPGTPDPGLARFRPGHGRAVREPQRRLAQ